MKRLCIAVLFLSVCCDYQSTLAQTPTRARTENGKEVLLFPNGTWKSVEEARTKESPNNRYQKAIGATTLFKPERGNFGVWYDEKKWKIGTNQTELGSRTGFNLLRGDGYALVIAEGLQMPLSALRQAAIGNATAVSKDAKVIVEETRTVNGNQVLFMQIDGTIQDIPFSYLGYYYSGKQGAIQVITYTGQSLVSKYRLDMEEFLNGLEVYQ
jgi:hypothetical protein